MVFGTIILSHSQFGFQSWPVVTAKQIPGEMSKAPAIMTAAMAVKEDDTSGLAFYIQRHVLMANSSFIMYQFLKGICSNQISV